MLATIFNLLCAVIPLSGVSGDALRARASFDANNVQVGDPLILTVDFIGSADFSSLHPPALSREVDTTVWKVDDTSAKTETYQDARRLVYRVRPIREGVFEFPSLAFSYTGPAEQTLTVTTRAVPVHVKAAAQAALSEVEETQGNWPMPDGLIYTVSTPLSKDLEFAWRRACANPTVEAFAAFDFPEARLNEAAVALLAGNWARAERIYSLLEWQIGQTPTIERGWIAARARKTDNPAAELPVWRVVARPLLSYAWLGRLLWVLGGFAALFLIAKLLGRLIRLVAVFLICAGVSTASADEIFDHFEKMHRQMQEEMENMMNNMGNIGSMINGGGGGFGTLTINGRTQPKLSVTATAQVSSRDLRIGENFEFYLSLEVPKGSSISQVRLTPSERFGLITDGSAHELPDGVTDNPSNEVKRIAVPVRYDVPFRGDMTFHIEGMISGVQNIDNGGRGSIRYSFSQGFSVETPPLAIEIKPLPTEHQPTDFKGVVGRNFKLTRFITRNGVQTNKAETNDVVMVVSELSGEGYIPYGIFPDEISRRPGAVTWTDYYIADGAQRLPAASVVVYDVRAKNYKTVTANELDLFYVATSDEQVESVAVDAGESAADCSPVVKLHFAPRETSPILATRKASELSFTVCETQGAWARIDTGQECGWIKKDNLALFKGTD